ncbi:hypothetical protein GL982_10785 (plasmid) [Spiroplasma citri]|uniref:Uncharacterized protein n=1 Tax=Spiroplasma citri TaxID=2133 RepID=A0AAJ4ELE8_SPICI|nr:ETX/MTX2 family pore-forming toxin [Spiroplasma citri]QIA69937.1 hypothetical protein GL298_10935 [Spiroplasma citri]QIA71959.1 hypothetical protein GL981_11725 [Spiroplasma citri]QIA74029.1 hypothetical protein GL982_10785 [Spiroplasma citri]
MKKLLSLIGTGMLAVSAVAPLVANTTYEPKTTDQLTLSYTEQQIKNDELPIPNAGNWDLSTGKGYFGYLWYCICYFYQNEQPHFNYGINLGAFGANTDQANKNGNYFYLGWDDSLQEKWMLDTNNGIVNISEIKNQSKSELDHSHDILTNNSDKEQNLSTSSYSHQRTVGHSLKLGMKISTTIDIDAYVLGTKISVEISAEGTWTDTVTDTYNAPTQKVNVPANSEIDVEYFFYKTVDQVDTWIYKKYDTSQCLYIALPTNGDYPLNYVNYPAKDLFDWITQYENTDWIFNIQNGYIQKKDGNFYIKSTIPISYENDGTEFVVILNPEQPLKEDI